MNFQTSCFNIKIRDLGAKLCLALLLLLFWKELQRLKSKSPRFLLNKNITFNKNESRQNQKWKSPHTILEWCTECFPSYKNRKLKVKLWWDGVHERKKRTFCSAYFVWNTFFNICVLSLGIPYWINFQNIYTFV